MVYCQHCGAEGAEKYCGDCGRPQGNNPPRKGKESAETVVGLVGAWPASG